MKLPDRRACYMCISRSSTSLSDDGSLPPGPLHCLYSICTPPLALLLLLLHLQHCLRKPLCKLLILPLILDATSHLLVIDFLVPLSQLF